MLILALLLVVATPEPVAAKLTRAETAAAALDLDIARDILLDVVTDPAATPEQLRRAHLLAGEVDRILGKDVEARMHFLWVLQRDPDTQLPPDKPPKISAFFELVRGEVKGRPAAPAAAPAAAPLAAPAAPVVTPLAQEPHGGALSASNAANAASASNAASGLPLPAIVAAVGGVGAAGGVALALVGESQFAATGAAWTDREGGQYTAMLGWTVAGAGAVVATAGLLLWSAKP